MRHEQEDRDSDVYICEILFQKGSGCCRINRKGFGLGMEGTGQQKWLLGKWKAKQKGGRRSVELSVARDF